MIGPQLPPTEEKEIENNDSERIAPKHNDFIDSSCNILKKPLKHAFHKIGPSFPENFTKEKEDLNIKSSENVSETASVSEEEHAESDDEIGPRFSEFIHSTNFEEERKQRSFAFEEITRKQLSQDFQTSIDVHDKKREDWMVIPPKPSNLNASLGVKARTFNTGKSAQSNEFSVQDMSVWTESYDEKKIRLKQEAMGIKTSICDNKKVKEKKDITLDTEKQKSHIGSKRPSLYDMHFEINKKMIDDPSKRMFDREKDVLGENYMNFEKKQKLMSFAKDMSRFSSGTYL